MRQDPTHQPRFGWHARQPGDLTIGRHLALWNTIHNLPDTVPRRLNTIRHTKPVILGQDQVPGPKSDMESDLALGPDPKLLKIYEL